MIRELRRNLLNSHWEITAAAELELGKKCLYVKVVAVFLYGPSAFFTPCELVLGIQHITLFDS